LYTLDIRKAGRLRGNSCGSKKKIVYLFVLIKTFSCITDYWLSKKSTPRRTHGTVTAVYTHCTRSDTEITFLLPTFLDLLDCTLSIACTTPVSCSTFLPQSQTQITWKNNSHPFRNLPKIPLYPLSLSLSLSLVFAQ
jgi:hypothetical protein